MAKNIKFKYLYRDAGNYKNFGHVIFQNLEDIPTDEINNRLEKGFVQRIFFVTQQVKLPELFFEDFPSEDDVSFHEFDGIEITDESPDDLIGRTIKQFLEIVEVESLKGWMVFDPMERLFHFANLQNDE